MPPTSPTRDQLASDYFDQLEFVPYPVQEDALLNWFASEQGVLVCAPTGTGKTLIAEAALFEALKTGRRAYYTTPLIALTEQKLQEMQAAAVRWGFSADDIGLVTGNRRVNPDAPILVVVAEILFNRLLHREQFEFDDVCAVVMDEFHSFNDPERGIVWELTLGLLPEHVRLLLLSATVGNAYEFTSWLRRAHNRNLELVQSDERKVPLTYHWIGDALLTEHLEWMAAGSEEARYTPALVFCFNREQCWNVAEQLKGKAVLHEGQQKRLLAEMEQYDWSQGAGPKLKQILQRGVGVHHAGVLPKYRRIVEELFQQKLLSVCVCTETLAAGINLPARSVVIPELLKGPPDKKRLIEASAAHQMFGRAGRPQFDTQGHIFALAHEDDVKHLRWKVKYDQIPEDTKDPGLRKAKKALKKKMPKRRSNQQYWTEQQFDQLRNAPSSKLASRGPLPWRLLAYMLDVSPDLGLIRSLIDKRLLDGKQFETGQKILDRMLMTLWTAGYVTLDPEPPKDDQTDEATMQITSASQEQSAPEAYRPQFAQPTEALQRLLHFRGVNPLFGVFLLNHLGVADRTERIQAIESILEIPGSVARFVRVPKHEEMPPGPLATTRLDVQLLRLGLVTLEQLGAAEEEEDDNRRRRGDGIFEEERVWVLTLAEKLQLLFDHDFPGVHDVRVVPVWAAGELLEFGGDFNNFITSHGLQKQEGVIFRHVLRMILLLAEFKPICPPDTTAEEWRTELDDITDRLAESCRRVDPMSTDKTLEQAEQASEIL
ncbi:MAG TPA: DEAD/DEAH box helicase [Pirellulaceae bacterium]|nr:DEAD/DEAH box helicase [Pirellulaceae bacterium]